MIDESCFLALWM